MFRRLLFLLSVVLLLGMAATASADLMAHWRFNEATGDTVEDASGNGNTGTIEDAVWVGGKDGAALQFNGETARVVVPDSPSLHSETGDISIAAWINVASDPTTWGNAGPMVFKQDAYQWNVNSNGALWFGIWGARLETIDTYNFADHVGEWHHATLTFEGATQIARIYVDGELNIEGVVSEAVDPTTEELYIGFKGDGGTYFHGVIDDVRIYDSVLTQGEILAAMEGGEGYPFAFGPEPADGGLHEDTWANLSWKPGDFAVSHDVYLSADVDEVDDGAESAYQGNYEDTFIVVGFPGFPVPDGLVPGTTYYWRVDEVNDADPNSPWKGEIWSFSIPPKTAYSPVPADGAEAVEVDAELSWTPGFGAKLHTVYFGESFEAVDTATGGQSQGSAAYTPGPLEMAKTYYWRVDEFDVVETHKGDVWSFVTEGAAGNPSPAKGAADVTQTPVLRWEHGVFADTYELYFGTDPASLELKASGNRGEESFEPGQLEWDTTYYWRVDEANDAHPDSPWTGPLWSFTTANFLIIDDFESYNDLNPDDPNSNRIFLAWIDGFDDPTNGSIVGHTNPPFAEQSIVHSGSQSMPFAYDNAVGKSEAALTLTENRNWTVNGVDRLTVWYRGSSANSAEPMYVVLNGSAGVDSDDPEATQKSSWTEWSIALAAFADQGVNLTNVTSTTLGVGNRNNPTAGGAGMIYFDDIRLYPPAQ
jgi:hypothetical protein